VNREGMPQPLPTLLAMKALVFLMSFTFSPFHLFTFEVGT
jgi:hypothetical protein